MDPTIIGSDSEIVRIKETIDHVAPINVPILLLGETGVGKDLFAHYIHKQSQREGNFICINCAAIQDTLLESELFGHIKGAFSGAMKTKLGKIELADKGTLFLNEIGSMSPKIQAKILQVLEYQQFVPVGGTKNVEVDIRIISATNCELSDMVKNKEFRCDLLYRLNTITLEIPPLRERQKKDILDLAQYFLNMYSIKYNKQYIKKLDPSNKKYVLENKWIGNIRELENTIKRSVILSNRYSNFIIDTQTKGINLAYLSSNTKNYLDELIDFASGTKNNNSLLYEIEKLVVQYSLEQSGSQHDAAKILGISTRTMHYKTHKYGFGDIYGTTKRKETKSNVEQ